MYHFKIWELKNYFTQEFVKDVLVPSLQQEKEEFVLNVLNKLEKKKEEKMELEKRINKKYKKKERKKHPYRNRVKKDKAIINYSKKSD